MNNTGSTSDGTTTFTKNKAKAAKSILTSKDIRAAMKITEEMWLKNKETRFICSKILHAQTFMNLKHTTLDDESLSHKN